MAVRCDVAPTISSYTDQRRWRDLLLWLGAEAVGIWQIRSDESRRLQQGDQEFDGELVGSGGSDRVALVGEAALHGSGWWTAARRGDLRQWTMDLDSAVYVRR